MCKKFGRLDLVRGNLPRPFINHFTSRSQTDFDPELAKIPASFSQLKSSAELNQLPESRRLAGGNGTLETDW
jgi:hypothetical protein